MRPHQRRVAGRPQPQGVQALEQGQEQEQVRCGVMLHICRFVLCRVIRLHHLFIVLVLLRGL